jgi:hypothetical protein
VANTLLLAAALAPTNSSVWLLYLKDPAAGVRGVGTLKGTAAGLLLLIANAAVAVTLLVAAAAVVACPATRQAMLQEKMRPRVARVARNTH